MVEMADSECKAVFESRKLDLSRFQCGQSGEELESRFAEISVRLEAEQQILSNQSTLMDMHTQEIQGSA